jgi:hypothetical protein
MREESLERGGQEKRRTKVLWTRGVHVDEVICNICIRVCIMFLLSVYARLLNKVIIRYLQIR